MDVTIRPAREEDFEEVVAWHQENGWVDDVEDLKLFKRVYGDGVIVAEDNTGSPVGFATWNILGPDIGLGAKIIVKKEHRGKGIGKKLVCAYKSCIGDRNAWLHAEIHAVDFYKKYGFVHEGYNAEIFLGSLHRDVALDVDSTVEVVRRGVAASIDDIVAYDEEITGLQDRKAFLTEFAVGSENYLISATTDGIIVGFLIAHLINNVYRVAPFYANTAKIANRLIQFLSSEIPEGSTIELNTFTVTESIEYITEKYKLKKMGSALALFSKNSVNFPMEKIYSFAPF
ncbi:unnamed protein product [Owenia fusiformis]|uniref:Uncharacterized protein n=1 Tax=Owenia fusiformis TaxID=6347 RepID=A0A8J1UAC0_OWEFU|nr:unnamed protein product [Owenia fusiformis]